MEDQKVLGQRIRSFRKRAGLSQMNLELELESSPGSLSRIENGEVNPTKETLYKISDHLDLSNQERQYLYGSWFNPASESEVLLAIEDTSEYFNKKGVLAYILDERFRFISVSRSFRKILGFSAEQEKQAYLQPFISLIVNNEFGIRDLFPDGIYEELLFNILASFYSDCGFMQDDEIVKAQIETITKNKISRKIWEEILEKPIRKYNEIDSRKVILKISGVEVEMHYVREPLYRNRRFEIVEYSPSHPFVKLINKLVM